ncbi:hypothetical protein SK128_012708, partial [Halocaridina rubra]
MRHTGGVRVSNNTPGHRGYNINQPATHVNKPRARVAPQIMSISESGRCSSDRRNVPTHSNKTSEDAKTFKKIPTTKRFTALNKSQTLPRNMGSRVVSKTRDGKQPGTPPSVRRQLSQQ